MTYIDSIHYKVHFGIHIKYKYILCNSEDIKMSNINTTYK